MRWTAGATGLVIGAVVLTACAGIGGRGGSEAEIHGAVFSDHRIDMPCDAQAARQDRPEELSGIELRFSDGSGKPLGTATTGPLEIAPLDYGCRFSAGYRAAITPAPRYRVEFDPPPPREVSGAYFEGADLLEPQEISHADLEAAGFEWSFEAEPAYAVP